MEQHILKVNKFLLVIPTIYTFLVHFLEISSADVDADVREKLDKLSKVLFIIKNVNRYNYIYFFLCCSI